MLSVFNVSCIIEKPHRFTEGDGIVVYDTILVVYARDETRVRQLVSGLEQEGIKINIKTVAQVGATEQSETIMKSYDRIIESRLA